MHQRIALSLVLLTALTACGSPEGGSASSPSASDAASSAPGSGRPDLPTALPSSSKTPEVAASSLQCTVSVGATRMKLRQLPNTGAIEVQELQFVAERDAAGNATLREVTEDDVERMAYELGDTASLEEGKIPFLSRYAARLSLRQALARLNERLLKVQVTTRRNPQGMVYDQASIFLSVGDGEHPVGTKASLKEELRFFDPHGTTLRFPVNATGSDGGQQVTGASLTCVGIAPAALTN